MHNLILVVTGFVIFSLDYFLLPYRIFSSKIAIHSCSMEEQRLRNAEGVTQRYTLFFLLATACKLCRELGLFLSWYSTRTKPGLVRSWSPMVGSMRNSRCPGRTPPRHCWCKRRSWTSRVQLWSSTPCQGKQNSWWAMYDNLCSSSAGIFPENPGQLLCELEEKLSGKCQCWENSS